MVEAIDDEIDQLEDQVFRTPKPGTLERPFALKRIPLSMQRIITILFIPISFIAGFFGMNFFLPAEPFTAWMSHPIFYVALGLILPAPIFIFSYMRKRKWI